MNWRAGRSVLLLGFALAHLTLAASEIASTQDPVRQRRDLPLAPPTELRWFDAGGRFHLRPFIHPWRPDAAAPGKYVPDSDRSIPLRFFAPAPGNRLFGLIPCPFRLLDTEPPGELHLLGTDALGRDLFSRFLHGGRLSLLTALLATTLALGVGAASGLFAAYFAGLSDRAVVWGAQLTFALPWFYLLLAVRGSLPLELPPGTTWVVVSMIMGLAGWGRTGILVRAAVAGEQRQDYVLAAIGLGLSPWRVLWRHILPTVRRLLLTQGALLLPRFVIAEVTLSFLGMGIYEPQPSWGNLLSILLRPDGGREHPWLFLPALGLALCLLGYQLVADRLSGVPRAL